MRDHYRKPTAEGQPTVGRKATGNRWADGQKPHRRPTRRGKLAQHSEARGFSRAGKCGGRAGKQRALIWGDPREEMPREVSRGHSTAHRGNLVSGRAEPASWDPTTGPQATMMTPHGRVAGLEDSDGEHGAPGMRPSGHIVRWGVKP